MRLLRRTPAPAEDLLRRVGEGDRAALAVLRADLPPRTVAALRRLVPTADASALSVVTEARSVARGGPEDLRPLAELLLEGDVRTAAAVAELLDVREQDVLAAAGRRPACRAWSLLSGAHDLTEQEREAGRAHVASCRPCSALLDGERAPQARALAG